MIFEDKRVVLKNGIECILRSPGPEDAEEMLAHLRKTSGETDYIHRYPEEVIMTVVEEKDFISKCLEDPKSLMLSAVIDGKIIATAGLNCVLDVYKCRHRASFGIAVMKEFWDFGLGTLIVDELIKSAEKAGYEQLELEVNCRNEQAVRLYQKLGFRIYGTRDRSFKFKDGTYSSNYLMLLALGPCVDR